MKFLLPLFTFFVTSIFHAQIKGKVIDSADKIPIEYASVSLFDVNNTIITGVITDANGYFEIKNSTPQQYYYIEVSFIGYTTKKSPLFLYSKNYNLGTITLDVSVDRLNEVVVKTEKKTFTSKIDKQIIETSKIAASVGGTANDVLKNIPAISINSEGIISYRGSSGIVYMINGKQVQGNAVQFVSQIPANSIQRVELITTPSAKYDSEGKTGIINIILKEKTGDLAFTQLNIKGGLPSVEPYNNANLPVRFGLDFTHSFSSKKWDFAFSTSYLRNDINGQRVGDVNTTINNKFTQFPSYGERSSNEINYSGRANITFT
ncbi:MAG TPA: TonB-dependent receptor, partial [Flavobacterium sp.]|nr:TonB-dependent receptor [Flavobacterium sp.]